MHWLISKKCLKIGTQHTTSWTISFVVKPCWQSWEKFFFLLKSKRGRGCNARHIHTLLFHFSIWNPFWANELINVSELGCALCQKGLSLKHRTQRPSFLDLSSRLCKGGVSFQERKRCLVIYGFNTLKWNDCASTVNCRGDFFCTWIA